MNRENEPDDRISGIEGAGEELRVFANLADFPVSECPAYLKEGVGGVCISGWASIQVFDTKFKMVSGMIFTLLPWQLVSLKEVSKDFRMTFFRVPLGMFIDTLSGLWRLRPGFFFYMRKHVLSQPAFSQIQRFLNYCGLLTFWSSNGPENCRREMIMQLLRVYYWSVYAVYINDPTEEKTRYSHKEELAFKFMQLIIEERSSGKDVAYYAIKLGVSSKYLTNLVRGFSGQSARDWIVYYTIFEIKSLLRDSTMSIKAIAARTNFADHAALSRFFRHYTGMTLSQYRESIHF